MVPAPPPQPPALLTAFRTITALCDVRHLLLTDAILVRLAVAARTRADPRLEAPAAQHLTAGLGERETLC